MNKAQYLDSLRRHTEEKSTAEQDQLLFAASQQIQQKIDAGQSEREAVDSMPAPAVFAARGGAASGGKRSAKKPFEPVMAAPKAKPAIPQEKRYPDEPRGKTPWALIAIVTVAAIVCVAFSALRILSSRGQLGYELKSQTFTAADIAQLIIADENCDVQVKSLTESDLRVDYYEGHHKEYSLSLDTGTLTVRSETNRRWYDRLLSLYDSTDNTLTVYLPQDYAGSITIQTSNGSITAANLDCVQALDLTTSNAALTLSTITAKRGITLHTSNTPILIQSVTAASLNAATTNGQVSLNDNHCATVKIETSNGLVELFGTGREVQALSVRTSNASIVGEIEGALADFRIHTETSNSKSSLPEQAEGERSLDLRTSNGQIQVSFLP